MGEAANGAAEVGDGWDQRTDGCYGRGGGRGRWRRAGGGRPGGGRWTEGRRRPTLRRRTGPANGGGRWQRKDRDGRRTGRPSDSGGDRGRWRTRGAEGWRRAGDGGGDGGAAAARRRLSESSDDHLLGRTLHLAASAAAPGGVTATAAHRCRPAPGGGCRLCASTMLTSSSLSLKPQLAESRAGRGR